MEYGCSCNVLLDSGRGPLTLKSSNSGSRLLPLLLAHAFLCKTAYPEMSLNKLVGAGMHESVSGH